MGAQRREANAEEAADRHEAPAARVRDTHSEVFAGARPPVEHAGVETGAQVHYADAVANMSLEMLERVREYRQRSGENIELRIPNAMREHPLFLIPRKERKALIDQALGNGKGDFVVPAYLLEGELTQKSRKIYDALLASYEGDWLKVLRHVQVERFYVSRRYREATVTVEPQLAVDARARQLTLETAAAYVIVSRRTR